MSALESGSLYVLLDLRSADLIDKTFHWALYLHKADKPYPRGHKYHIKTLGEGRITDHAPVSGITKVFLLVCLVRVAKDIPATRWDELEKLTARNDDHINDGGITCRIWVLQALERLRNVQILTCGDVVQLEEQLKNIGNSHRATAVQNQQPCPTEDLTSFAYYLSLSYAGFLGMQRTTGTSNSLRDYGLHSYDDDDDDDDDELCICIPLQANSMALRRGGRRPASAGAPLSTVRYTV